MEEKGEKNRSKRIDEGNILAMKRLGGGGQERNFEIINKEKREGIVTH